MDGQGNLFVADSGNNLIREVAPTGTITTYAGTPGHSGFTGDNGPATAATLSFPTDLAVDNQGNLFIADSSNNEVRRVSTAATTSGVLATDTPLINWQRLVGGVSEELAIVDQSNGQTFVFGPGLTGTAYQLTQAQALPRGHSFTWYIGAVSSGGGHLLERRHEFLHTSAGGADADRAERPPHAEQWLRHAHV